MVYIGASDRSLGPRARSALSIVLQKPVSERPIYGKRFFYEIAVDGDLGPEDIDWLEKFGVTDPSPEELAILDAVEQAKP